ncbi:MAG: carbohydrate-binding domain-containing protein [Oscillospiraceae bacterium]|nr:carbohydrate-binding domain-containing protein [Oscillospiraceae bacterium]
MKKILKTTMTTALAFFVLAGCGFSSVCSAEGTASNTASTVLSAEQLPSVSERDASGDYDVSEAVTLSPEDDLTITEAGVYLLSGRYDSMIMIDAGEEAKVQLVLKNAALTNDSGPAIYVRSADKVFLTAAEGTANTISDGSAYSYTDEETTPDAAIFSRDDLTINGEGKLTITGNYKHAVVSKDDLVVTAKNLTVSAASTGLNGKESVALSEASVAINAGSNGIRSDEIVSISGDSVKIDASEGIEATHVLITGGDVTVNASDDGINAAQKSTAYTPTVEITGGTVTVTMGAGDTDGIDSNGDIIITGGIISVNAGSAFDYDGSATFTGGTVYVNGQQVSTLPNQMMGRGMGGFHGQGGFGSRPEGQEGFGGETNGEGMFDHSPRGQDGFGGDRGGRGDFGSRTDSAEQT